jgi:glycosyltransferase involved in cell wall biosynthesis
VSARARLSYLISESSHSAYFEAFAAHHDRDRFEFSLTTLAPAGDLNRAFVARGVPAFSLDCRGRADYPRAIASFAAHLRRQRIDILQVHLFEASLVGLLAARLAGTPLAIFTGHHSAETVLSGNPLSLAADKICSRWLSHFVIVHCQQMKETLVRAQGVPPARIAVIPLGFELDRWRASDQGRQRVRRDLGLEGRAVIGAVGRLQWIKDYPRLFRALQPLFEAHPQAVLLVLGDGPEGEPLRRLASELGLTDRIVFAGKRPDMADCLAAMDLFVHASLTESFCQVLVEAQLIGLPVVTTPVGIAPELVEDGINGFVVPTADTEGLRQGLVRALAARDRWAAMGAEGRRRCDRFSIVTTVAAHEAQYLNWLAARR